MKLVTGGSGFVGSHLVQRLTDLNEKVRILDVEEPPNYLKKRSFEFVKGDIRDFEIVYKVCEDVDVVFHTSALVPVSKAGSMFREVNVKGTQNVLEASLKRGVKKFVHISTSAVYGIPKKAPIDENYELNPLGDYGRSKLEAELLCQKYMRLGLETTILRPRALVGPGRLGLFGILFDWIHDGKKVYIIGSGDNRYQMLSIPDLVEACVLASKKGSGEIFNLGSDRYLTVGEELEAIITHAGTNSRVTPLNKTLSKFVLRTLDVLHLSPLTDWHYLGGGEDFIFDTTKAKKNLCWYPKYSDVEMLIAAYDWYIEHYEEAKLAKGTTHRQTPPLRLLKLLKYIS